MTEEQRRLVLSSVLTNYPNEKATILNILLEIYYDIIIVYGTYLNVLIGKLVAMDGCKH